MSLLRIDPFAPASGPPPRSLLAFFRWCLQGAGGVLGLAGGFLDPDAQTEDVQKETVDSL